MPALSVPAAAEARAVPTVDAGRRSALFAGVFYLVTFAASFPALALLRPVVDDPGWVLASGGEGRVVAGNLLDLVNAVACVGTAVALFPVLRRHGEALALGFVTSRVVEAATIVVGAVALLSVVSLRGSDAEPGALTAVAAGLEAAHRWAFLLGPGIVAGVNALLLGTLMLRSRLVPRAIPLVGLVGAPLLLASGVATMFGVWEQVSPVSALAALPVAGWELSLGLWLTLRGFREAA